MINQEEEVWASLIENNKYEVSNTGKIRRGNKVYARRNQAGYLSVLILTNDNIYKEKLVHRAVADAFLPNPHNLPVINHKDFDKANNHYTNLEWCTQRYNIQHAFFLTSTNRCSFLGKNSKVIMKILRDNGLTYSKIAFYLKCSEENVKQTLKKFEQQLEELDGQNGLQIQ